ncbi:MAG: hypothetical protein VYE37_03565 [Pseudomonadota bacterium]|nr:hypothetical protein [Pseudomonadota bacterium]
MMFLPGESLQSFIFRNMSIAGSLDFSCVVDDTGSWVARPRVPEKYQHIFHMFDEEILLEITRNSGLAPEPSSLFGNPTSAVVALTNIFAGENSETAITNGIQIAFCEKCMKSSLVENGFAYFRANWLFASYCDEHNTRLSILKNRRRGAAISAVKDILTGDYPTGTSSLRKSFEKERYTALSFGKKKKYKSSVHYMPCTVPPILSWLHEHINVLKGNEKLKKRYWIECLASTQFIMPHDLEKICADLEKEEPNLFRDFVRSKLTKRKVSFGLWDVRSFTTDVYKVKVKQCSRCSESMGLGICPMSPKPQNGERDSFFSSNNESLVACNIIYTHKIEVGQCKVAW